LKTADLQKKLL